VSDISPDAKFNIATGLQLALIEDLTHNSEKFSILTKALESSEDTGISEVMKAF